MLPFGSADEDTDTDAQIGGWTSVKIYFSTLPRNDSQMTGSDFFFIYVVEE